MNEITKIAVLSKIQEEINSNTDLTSKLLIILNGFQDSTINIYYKDHEGKLQVFNTMSLPDNFPLSIKHQVKVLIQDSLKILNETLITNLKNLANAKPE